MRTLRKLAVPLGVALAALAAPAGTALAVGTGHHHVRAASRHNRPARPQRQPGVSPAGRGALPVTRIEKTLGASGSMSNGVLTIGIDRNDINNVRLGNIPIKPSFQVNGEIDFQPLGHGQALMNGDFPFKPSELDTALSTMVSNHITFQAEHQHMYDFSPMVWFMHFRARGNAVRIAHEMRNVINTTSTPLPQSTPPNPPTPLNVNRLKRMLHGYDAEVSDSGVVTVYVARRNPVFIDGLKVNPATNIATNVSFEPLNSSGTRAAVVPDFAMQAQEINRVVGTMRSMNWDIGCLYNQETGESPQLYFSHEFKTGDPYELAREVRNGLNHTNAQ